MQAWIAGPPQTPQTLAGLRALGVPEAQVTALEAVPPPQPLWACNLPAFSVFKLLPFAAGPRGVSGLDWHMVDRVCKELRIHRRDRRELPPLLRHCETVAMEFAKQQAPD